MKRLSSVLIVGLMVVGMAGWGCSNTTPETPKTDTKMSSTEKPADKMADATKPADTKPADAPKPAETASTKPADTTPAPTTPVKPATPEKTVALNTSGDTVKVGILHSLSGTMAISETSLKDVELMAIDQINEAGGVLGKKVVPVVVDPASNWDLFAEKAKELITVDKVVATFGCWTSVSRKSVLPVFEEYNQLLFY
ncbi:MAG TPA: transporter substrate-binding protein, partial [Pirellulales bacterium]|nr:transporter substrate-binding protein [Pirellulales bacterium]